MQAVDAALRADSRLPGHLALHAPRLRLRGVSGSVESAGIGGATQPA